MAYGDSGMLARDASIVEDDVACIGVRTNDIARSGLHGELGTIVGSSDDFEQPSAGLEQAEIDLGNGLSLAGSSS